ncbi:MAG: hypothetical protein PF795_07495 [Kiritimatiellae bacterium]|jgi:hypothetical protein|nr:hypothetical protein [Kiritimatiellia bacterium]
MNPNFFFILPLILLNTSPLGAQLEIQLIEDVQVGPVGEAAGVEAPDSADHSQPERGLESDQVHFLNGDRLQGRLQSVDAEAGLHWAHPDVESDILFGLANIGSVLFKSEGKGVEDLHTFPRVMLTNGDEYRGRIVGMDADTLVLDSPFAGRIQLQSAMIDSIRPYEKSTAIYEGPNSQEEWEYNRSGSDRWTFKDGAMYAGDHNQVMGRHLGELPDFVKVEFRLEWKGNVNFQVGFWGQDPKNTNQNCYTIAIQNGYLRAYRNYNDVGRTDLGNAQLQKVTQVSEIDVTLLLNRPGKEILFFVDDELVNRWNDSFEGEIKGNALILGAMGNTPTKVSNISVREWDGEFKTDTGEKSQPHDQLLTINGDSFMGTLEKIEADTLHFNNDFASFQVPMERVSEIRFSKENRQVPRLRNGDMKLVFGNQEHITLRIKQLKGGTFVGDSETTGEIKVVARYLSMLRFNPYDERHQVEEESW